MTKILMAISPVVSSAVLFLGQCAHGQSMSTMAGLWNGITFGVPSQLTTVTSSNGVVIHVNEKQAFGAETFQVTIFSDGTFSSAEGGGSFAITGQGSFNVYPSGSPAISFRANHAQDVFAGLTRADSGNDARNACDLLLRAPSSLTAVEVAGTWRMLMFSTPQELIEVLTTNGALQDLKGMDGESLSNSDFSMSELGSMNFDSSGTLSGVAEGNFTGTFALGGSGQINVLVNTGEGMLPLTCFINASKSTMFALLKEDSGNRQELLMLTKNPTNVTPTDLRGVWNVTSYGVPTSLTLWKNTNNLIVNITSSSDFTMNQDAQFIVGHDGFLTGVLEGEPNIGVMTASSDGTTTAVFTNRLGVAESHTGYLNAGKDCIVFPDSSGQNRGFTIVSKAPDWPGAAQNFGLQIFTGGIVWASETNLVLQSSGTLGGTWTNVPNTLGQHQFQPALSNGTVFYRVVGH